jgi:excisionase family DNA binding protein
LTGLLSVKAYIGIRCIATGILPNWGNVGIAVALIGGYLQSPETIAIGSILMRISTTKGLAEPLFRPGDLITAAEVCKLLAVSRTKLWKMHQDGKAPPHIDLGRQVRRYSRPAVMQWLQKALR